MRGEGWGVRGEGGADTMSESVARDLPKQTPRRTAAIRATRPAAFCFASADAQTDVNIALMQCIVRTHVYINASTR